MATASHGLPAGAQRGTLDVKLFHPLQRDTASATNQGKARGGQNVTYCEPKPYLLHGKTIPFGGQKVWFGQATLWATPFCTFISILNALSFLRENLRHEAPKSGASEWPARHFPPARGASRAAIQQKREASTHRRKPLFCCPKRIRTTTNRTKTCCATVTP